MEIRSLLTAVFLLGFCVAAGLAAYRMVPQHMRWAVYYGSNLPYADFARYDVLAFDSDAYPDFAEHRREGQVILGYLSTSEAEEYRPYYKDIADMGVFIRPSDQWDAHMVIDIREQAWQDYFVHRLVPQVLAKGFDGIMLDTIDTPLYLEEAHPDALAGMHEAAVRLVKAIRTAHPDIRLMLNRGFPILDEVAGELDYILAESVRVDHRLDDGSSRYFPDEVYAEYVEKLREAQRINPGLQAMTLDYWDMSDKMQVRRIYAEQRAHGFVPYVTTADLARHHKEPL